MEQKLQALRFGPVEIVIEGDLNLRRYSVDLNLLAGRSGILRPELPRPFGRALLPV